MTDEGFRIALARSIAERRKEAMTMLAGPEFMDQLQRHPEVRDYWLFRRIEEAAARAMFAYSQQRRGA